MTEHEIRKVEVEAFVYSRETPTDEQLKKVQDFLEKKYNAAVAVIPKQDDSVRDGFRIEIGTSTYKWNLDRIFDWSAEGRAKQLKQSISEAIRGQAGRPADDSPGDRGLRACPEGRGSRHGAHRRRRNRDNQRT